MFLIVQQAKAGPPLATLHTGKADKASLANLPISAQYDKITCCVTWCLPHCAGREDGEWLNRRFVPNRIKPSEDTRFSVKETSEPEVGRADSVYYTANASWENMPVGI